MNGIEKIETFFSRHNKKVHEHVKFNVYKVGGDHRSVSKSLFRRDYYKVSLICKGKGALEYPDKTIFIEKPAIILSNPMVPYRWQATSNDLVGYFCIFTEEFIHPRKNTHLSEAAIFNTDANPVLFPDKKSLQRIEGIFEQMILEGSYRYRDELLQNYLQVLLHETIKLQEPSAPVVSTNAKRISDHFFELLQQQFPIVSTDDRLMFKTANDFAERLSVHVNHLNKSLKLTTGRTTSEHITKSMINEAKALLVNSSWDIADMAYCLGFEHPANFNIFFKKQTGQTPGTFRKRSIANS